MSFLELVLEVVVSAVVSAAVSLTSYVILSRRLCSGPGLLWVGEEGRSRRRYVVFEVATSAEVDENDVRAAIEAAFTRLFGEVGMAESGLKMIMYDKVRRRGVIRVRSEGLQRLLAALGTVRRVGQVDAAIVPLRTAGTIRKARKYVYQ